MSEFALFRWRGVLAAGLLVCGSGILQAQRHQQQEPALQPQESKETVIQTHVRRVVVDVVVTGPHGDPVRGLTAKDFLVKEDGKAQTIKTFDAYDFDAQPSFVPPKLPPMPANTFLNLPKEAERGPLFVLLYDLVNIEMSDQKYARAQLLKFIENKPAGTRFAVVVLSDGMHLVQGFTEDKNALLATLDLHSGRPHVPEIFLYGRNYGNGDSKVSASEFTELAHYLEGFNGRKNVLWFSGKFPLSLFANLDNDVIGDGEYTEKVKDLVDTLTRDQIAIYPIDVEGAIVTEVYGPPGSAGADVGPTSDARGAPMSAAAVAGQPAAAASSGGSHASTGQGFSQTASQDMAEEGLAKATGGHAYYGTNDLTALLSKATTNGSNYYTVSYSPTNQEYNGKLRSIHVELVEKKGYSLAYRQSYFGVDHSVRPRAETTVELAGARGSIPQDDPLSTEMRHGGPMAHELIFRAQLHAVGAPAMATPEQMAMLTDDAGALRASKQKKQVKAVKPVQLQSYRVDYRVMDTQAKANAPATGAAAPTLEFVAAAFDADGNMLSGVLQNASRDSSGKAEASQSKFFQVEQELAVPLNAAWIRVAVRDLSTNRVGTLEVKLPLEHDSTDAAAGKGAGSSL